ncbi:MAG: hypothetical protein QOD44_864 [Solirubrobacteraceae bacterium]|nr:hypothetical protein [Solirubrobacteraceae bacterium]
MAARGGVADEVGALALSPPAPCAAGEYAQRAVSHPGQPPEAARTAVPADLEAAIAALWNDAQPRALAGVAVIERAVAALGAGTLPAELADEARRDAHKLAGALGTFGMPDGTVHARAIELRLEAGTTPADAGGLREHARLLRAIVEAGGA